MTKWSRAVWSVVLVLFCMTLVLSGCARQQNQAEQPPHSGWRQDHDTIRLYHHQTDTVEELPLEEYLCGVVAAEMDPAWPRQALAAQAILARTFTLEKMEDNAMAQWNADASTDIHAFQAYDASRINEAVRQAVAQTENQVVTCNGQLIKAWFFADGGGVTAASAVEGLAYDKEETPYIHSVEDPGATLADNPNNHWQATFSMAQLTAAVEQVTGQHRERFEQAVIDQTGPSGRAVRYRFDDVTVGAAALRLALGGEEMKSNLVEELVLSKGSLQVRGRGYGHGVGMSQWGARAMALQGATAEDIIGYFFRDVALQTVEQTG